MEISKKSNSMIHFKMSYVTEFMILLYNKTLIHKMIKFEYSVVKTLPALILNQFRNASALHHNRIQRREVQWCAKAKEQ